MRLFKDTGLHSELFFCGSESLFCHSERSEKSHEICSGLCEKRRDPSLSLRVTDKYFG